MTAQIFTEGDGAGFPSGRNSPQIFTEGDRAGFLSGRNSPQISTDDSTDFHRRIWGRASLPGVIHHRFPQMTAQIFTEGDGAGFPSGRNSPQISTDDSTDFHRGGCGRVSLSPTPPAAAQWRVRAWRAWQGPLNLQCSPHGPPDQGDTASEWYSPHTLSKEKIRK